MTGARSAAAAPPDGPMAEWPSYGGDTGGSRYSPLTQITKDNVTALRVAWEYHTGEVSDGSGGRRPRAFAATPLVAHGTLDGTPPLHPAVAPPPATRPAHWHVDPPRAVRRT